MSELLLNPEELKSITEYCKKCGMCLSHCPIYEASDRLESVSPRGKLIIGLGLLSGELKLDEILSHKLMSCVLCSECVDFCPAGLDIPNLILGARISSKVYEALPESLAKVIENIKTKGTPHGKDVTEKSKWFDLVGEVEKEGDVLLWSGCTSALTNPNLVATAYKLLKKLEGGSVTALRNEPCCYAMYVYTGNLDAYKEEILKVIERVKEAKAKVLVSLCPACTRSFRIYSKLVGIELPFRVLHVSEYLHEKLVKDGKKIALPNPLTAAYHDPCTLVRGLGVKDKQREVLSSIENLKWLEMKGTRNCCGGGGAYGLYQPDWSAKISSRRLKDVPEGVKTIITTCPTCEATFKKAIKRENLDIEVKDLVTLVYEGLKE